MSLTVKIVDVNQLRERDDLDDLPIIILTTSKDQNVIDRCYDLGAKSFITKPNSFTELVEIVKTLPEHKG